MAKRPSKPQPEAKPPPKAGYLKSLPLGPVRPPAGSLLKKPPKPKS